MNAIIPHELISVAGSLVGQILHIIKKKTEEDTSAAESSIFVKWILRRPINTLAASLVGIGSSLGLSAGDVGQVMTQTALFLQAVVVGIAANSVVNRPGDN